MSPLGGSTIPLLISRVLNRYSKLDNYCKVGGQSLFPANLDDDGLFLGFSIEELEEISNELSTQEIFSVENISNSVFTVMITEQDKLNM